MHGLRQLKGSVAMVDLTALDQHQASNHRRNFVDYDHRLNDRFLSELAAHIGMVITSWPHTGSTHGNSAWNLPGF